MRHALLVAALSLCVSPLFAQTTYNFSNYSTDGPALHSALADLDRDGYPDMAIVNQSAEGSGSGNTLDVFFNNHSGGFGPYTSYAIPSNGPVVAADVNGDGWPDLVIAKGSGSVTTVMLNNHDGSFHMGTPVTTKAVASAFVAGDFNKDGKIDLAAVEPNQIEILLNSGNATFSSKQVLGLGNSTFNAVSYDLDGDGNLDIALALPKKTLVWWGQGNGLFNVTPLTIPRPNGDTLYSIAAADFNNDAREDLVVSSNYVPACPPPVDNPCGTTTAHVYKNLGGRKFSLVSSFKMGDRAFGVLSAADVNSDRNYDVVNLINAAGVATGQFTYRTGNGAFQFGTERNITGGSAVELAFRDLNLDARQDVVIPNYFPDGEVVVGLATSGNQNCTGVGSGSLHSKICAPLANASVTSPVTVRAAGNSPVGVKRLEVWVDGKKVHQKLGDQLNHAIALSVGTHHLSVVAVDGYVGTSSTVETITVH
jgi:hypothetical protein